MNENPSDITNDLDRKLKLSYAAGIVDGEGSIGIYRNSHNGQYQLRITVEMTRDEAIELMLELFGGRLYSKPEKGNEKAKTSWLIFNSAAASALRELLPFFRIKKAQAETALLTRWMTAGNGKLTEEEKELRQMMHAEMKKMNARGVAGHANAA
jgi:hypothetical protein